jgi:hypothetical protein
MKSTVSGTGPVGGEGEVETWMESPDPLPDAVDTVTLTAATAVEPFESVTVTWGE